MNKENSLKRNVTTFLIAVVVGLIPGFIAAVAIIYLLDFIIGGMLFTAPFVDIFFISICWFFSSRMIFHFLVKRRQNLTGDEKKS